MYPYEKQYDQVLKVEKEGPIAIITFDCQEKSNCITEQQIDEFGAALDNVHWDKEVRVVILRGIGPISFGYGDMELIQRKLAGNLPEGRELMTEIANVIKKMYTISKPIIGLAEGRCIGGGCNLILSSDAVIASEKASFWQVFVNYALTPDTGGMWALQRLVGPMKAKMIAMCGEELDAQTAYEMGMVYKVAAADKAYDEAYALASKIAAKSPLGVNHIKQISNRLHEYSMDTYFQFEGDYITLGALSGDYKETLTAMAQQRAPKYKGY